MSHFYQDILDNSPAEISVINLAPGRHQFEVVFINKTKADNFGIDPQKAVGQKCYALFEPFRFQSDKNGEHCDGCPSLEAYGKTGRLIHRDWKYKHPYRHEIRICNITSRRIPNTDLTVEICRDGTIRKRVFELSLDLAKADTYTRIQNLIFDGFLQRMYFIRCRFYQIANDGESLVLKSFKQAVPSPASIFERELVEVETEALELTAKNSWPDKLLLEDKEIKPKFFYLTDIVNASSFQNSLFFNAISIEQCHRAQKLEKEKYPLWLDLPLSIGNKIIGKISLDLCVNDQMSASWMISDYEIELLDVLAKNISQAWENIRLLDMNELREIGKIVLVKKGQLLSDVLQEIVNSTSQFLSFDCTYLVIKNTDGSFVEVNRSIHGITTTTYSSLSGSIYAKWIEPLFRDRKENVLFIDPVPEEFKAQHPEKAEKIESWLLAPILTPEGEFKGVWKLDIGENHLFNDYLRDRIQLISQQIAIAIQSLQQDQELKKQNKLAVEAAAMAAQNLKEKESFYQTAEHEMIAPIEPIMSTFKLFKRKIEKLGITDKRLQQLPDEGIIHCQFLRYTFDNLDFLRQKNVYLDRVHAQIFKNVIIPVVETVREYANSLGVQIEYSGYQNVEKDMLLDVNRMRNVFFNLLRNAVKYSHKNTLITVRGIGASEGLSTIHIENKGIGVPSGWEEKIFQLYQRADNAKQYTAPGSGIGLYISRKIVEAHGGKIFLLKADEPTIFMLQMPKN